MVVREFWNVWGFDVWSFNSRGSGLREWDVKEVQGAYWAERCRLPDIPKSALTIPFYS